MKKYQKILILFAFLYANRFAIASDNISTDHVTYSKPVNWTQLTYSEQKFPVQYREGIIATLKKEKIDTSDYMFRDFEYRMDGNKINGGLLSLLKIVGEAVPESTNAEVFEFDKDYNFVKRYTVGTPQPDNKIPNGGKPIFAFEKLDKIICPNLPKIPECLWGTNDGWLKNQKLIAKLMYRTSSGKTELFWRIGHPGSSEKGYIGEIDAINGNVLKETRFLKQEVKSIVSIKNSSFTEHLIFPKPSSWITDQFPERQFPSKDKERVLATLKKEKIDASKYALISFDYTVGKFDVPEGRMLFLSKIVGDAIPARQNTEMFMFDMDYNLMRRGPHGNDFLPEEKVPNGGKPIVTLKKLEKIICPNEKENSSQCIWGTEQVPQRITTRLVYRWKESAGELVWIISTVAWERGFTIEVDQRCYS